jgi:phosphoglycerate dehydrogenase-like enzyme
MPEGGHFWFRIVVPSLRSESAKLDGAGIMSSVCQVGFPDDLLLEDGRLSFPGYDLGRLPSDPGIAIRRVPGGARHAAADLAGLDVLVSVPSMAALDAESVSGQGRLLGVVRVGVGCDDVDLPACTEAGIVVVVPSEAVRRPTSVAALTLILALATRLLDKDRLSRGGEAAWAGRAELRGRNLQGRVLGLVGCGSIGSDLAALVRPLGLRVMAFDPALTREAAAASGIECAELDAVLARADIVSVHCPLNADTRHLIDAGRIAMMRPGAWLVNTARGGIVDQVALAAALVSGHLGAAGLDVFDPEPLPRNDPLLASPNLVLGGHALNWTEELDADLARANVEAVFDLIQGRVPTRVVNPDVLASSAFLRKQAATSRRYAAARAAALQVQVR